MKKILALGLAAAMCMGFAAPAMADVQIAFSQIGQESDWRTANAVTDCHHPETRRQGQDSGCSQSA